MSLLSSKSVQLRLEPHRVDATFHGGFAGRTRLAASSRPIQSSAALHGADAASIAVSIDAVLQELALVAPLHAARLQVELADPLVHYDVAEGKFAGCSDRQLQSIARACVAELLGDSAGEHEVRWSLQVDERHLLICALPRALVSTLEEAARLRRMKLGSIRPGFAHRWNACGRTLKTQTAVFVVTSGTHAVIACTARRAICAISVGPWKEAAAAAPTGAASFAAQRKATPVTALLDARVDRLLASLGVFDSAPGAYVLVTPEAAAFAGASRWNVIQAPA